MTKHILLIGKTGTGKSSTANLLCGSSNFKSSLSSNSVTLEYQSQTVEYRGNTLVITDTPGVLLENNDSEKIEYSNRLLAFLKSTKDGIHVIIVVLSLRERFTKADMETFTFFSTVLGRQWESFSIIAFTHADLFDGEGSVDKYIKESRALFRMIKHNFNGRYIFTNAKDTSEENRDSILSYIIQISNDSNDEWFRSEHLTMAAEFLKSEEERIADYYKEKMKKHEIKAEKQQEKLIRKLRITEEQPDFLKNKQHEYKYICLDCKKRLKRDFAREHKNGKHHLIIKLLDCCGMVKTVVQLEEDSTSFRVYFPYSSIYGKRYDKGKKATTQQPFFTISSGIHSCNNKIISIGKKSGNTLSKIMGVRIEDDESHYTYDENITQAIQEGREEIFRDLTLRWQEEVVNQLAKLHVQIDKTQLCLYILDSGLGADIKDKIDPAIIMSMEDLLKLEFVEKDVESDNRSSSAVYRTNNGTIPMGFLNYISCTR